MKNLLLLFLTLTSITAFAQAPEVNTHVLKDSVHLGEPFKVAVAVKHVFSTDITIKENFKDGIEKVEFLPFPTRKLKDELVIDSAVYTFRVFSSKPSIAFRIPLAVVTTNDTILIPQTDSLRIHIVKNITSLPGTLHFEESAGFYEPKYKFDYISWGIVTGVIVVVLLLLVFIFSTRIRTWWKTRKLKKAFSDFQHYINHLPESLDSREELEVLLAKWKSTLGRIENKPLSAYTTKEINAFYSDQELHRILKEVDASIYGKQKSIQKSETVYLLHFSEKRLNTIIEQLNSKTR